MRLTIKSAQKIATIYSANCFDEVNSIFLNHVFYTLQHQNGTLEVVNGKS